jgi:SAM-dependent methyltransferase
VTTRWQRETGHASGPDYAKRFADLAATGKDMHGEVGLLVGLVLPGARVLDAGCGAGRIAIELARRGYDVVGVDLDPSMLAIAREQAPDIEWIESDLTSFEVDPVDLAVLAGNVMIYCEEGTESAILATVAKSVAAGGLVVAGFSLGRLTLANYDGYASAAGLPLQARYSTWDGDAFTSSSDYAVSIHRKVG